MHTFWCLKNVTSETVRRPICLQICRTFDIEPPARRVAIFKRKFPAAIRVPGIVGWLLQVYSFIHVGFMHVDFIVSIVPQWLASVVGFAAVQKWQNLNSANIWVKNTINFDSILRLLFTCKLKDFHDSVLRAT